MIEKLEKVIGVAFEKNGYDLEHASIRVSNRPELCDFQINSVFKIAKELGKNPIEIGESLVKDLNDIDNIDYYFESIEFVKPGFINLKIANGFLADELNRIIDSGSYGIEKVDTGESFVVDYGGPNIAKPLHVGHIRPAIIGQSIYEILKEKVIG